MKTKKRFLSILLSLTLMLVLVSGMSLTAFAEGGTEDTESVPAYTVEFTFNGKQYVMPGDSTVVLKEILDGIGLTGEVSAVEVSDSTLFSASNESGAWMVTAHQAFTSQEWMKASIDGAAYEIVVTDATYSSGTVNAGNLKVDDIIDAGVKILAAFVPPSQKGWNVILDNQWVAIDDWGMPLDYTTQNKCKVVRISEEYSTFYYGFVYLESMATPDAAYSATTSFTYDGNSKTAVSGTNVNITGDNTAINVGNYTAYVTPQEGHTWSDGTTNQKTVNWSINRINIDPTVSLNGWIYGDTANDPIVTGNTGNGNVTYTYQVNKNGNWISTKPNVAGTHSVKATIAQTTNYSSGTATADFTIAQREVGLSWENTSFTYNGQSHAPTATATGLVGTDTCTVTVTGEQTNYGTHTATANSLSNSNYELPSSKTTTFTIGQREVTLSWPTNTTYPYNGKIQSPTATAGNLVDGDDCTVTVTGGQKNVGSDYTATAAGLSNNNYKLPSTNTTCTFSISQAELTVKANDHTITFGDAPANNGVSYNGFQNGETSDVLGGTLTYSYNYAQYENVGNSYTITPGGLTSSNYDIQFANGTLTVNPKSVTPSLTGAVSKVYDGGTSVTGATTNTLVIMIDGAVNSDDVSAAIGSAAYASANKGTDISVTASDIALTGEKAENYILSETTASANVGEITVRPVTIKAKDQTVELNDTVSTTKDDVTIIETGSSLASGDEIDSVTLTGTTTAVTTNGTVSFDAVVIKNSGTDVTDNYDITRQNGVLTVTPVAASVSTPPTSNSDTTYNGNPYALVTAGSGVTEGCTLKYAVTTSDSDTAPADGWSTTVPEESKAGIYYVWYYVDASENENYSDSTKTKLGPIAIAKATMTLTLDGTTPSIEYDGQAHGVSIVVTGGTPANTMLGVTYSTEAEGTYSETSPTFTEAGTHTVHYKIAPDPANYEIVVGTATLTISGASITGTAKYNELLTAVLTPEGSNPTYAWYRGDSAGFTPSYSNKIAGAANGTYTLTVDDIGKYVKVVITDGGTTYTSAAAGPIVKLDGPAAPADAETAGFVPNYLTETFTVNDDFEVSSTNDDTGVITDASLTDVFDGSSKVYIRKKETTDTEAGDWLEVTLSSRPDAPTGLTTENATDGDTADGKIKGTTADMEYSLDNGTTWTDATATETTVKPGTYLVRVKTTNDTPAGKTTEVKVGDSLEDARTAARKELEQYRKGKNDSLYDNDGVSELNKAKTTGDTAIDNAKDPDAIKAALQSAKDAIDAVKTKAQKDQEAEAATPKEKPEEAKPANPEDKVAVFVNRCYELLLGRTPDEAGRKGWIDALRNRTTYAAMMVRNFIGSPEYQGKNRSSAATVELLYRLLLERYSDAQGKAGWAGMLDEGYDVAYVINGLVGSNEFIPICAKYNITNDLIPIGSAGAEPVKPASNVDYAAVMDFVTRCYNQLLDRQPDPTGLAGWTDVLANQQYTAANVVVGFAYSQEWMGKHYGSEESVRRLYRAMLNRDVDSYGLTQWAGVLKSGYPIEYVINGISTSEEFRQVCANMGIRAGAIRLPDVIVPAAPQYNEEKVKGFVTRLYSSLLGRSVDESGLNGYTALIMSGAKTPAQVVKEILGSIEFQGRNLGDEDYVRALYGAYLNRGVDETGLAGCLSQMAGGVSRSMIADSLSRSGEFKTIVEDMKQ